MKYHFPKKSLHTGEKLTFSQCSDTITASWWRTSRSQEQWNINLQYIMCRYTWMNANGLKFTCMLVAEAHTPTHMHTHVPNGCGMMEEGQSSYNDSRSSVITGDTHGDALACCGELRPAAASTGLLVHTLMYNAIFIRILLLHTVHNTCCVCKCTYCTEPWSTDSDTDVLLSFTSEQSTPGSVRFETRVQNWTFLPLSEASLLSCWNCAALFKLYERLMDVLNLYYAMDTSVTHLFPSAHMDF